MSKVNKFHMQLAKLARKTLFDPPEDQYNVETLIKLGKAFAKRYPNLVLVELKVIK